MLSSPNILELPKYRVGHPVVKSTLKRPQRIWKSTGYLGTGVAWPWDRVQMQGLMAVTFTLSLMPLVLGCDPWRHLTSMWPMQLLQLPSSELQHLGKGQHRSA